MTGSISMRHSDRAANDIWQHGIWQYDIWPYDIW